MGGKLWKLGIREEIVLWQRRKASAEANSDSFLSWGVQKVFSECFHNWQDPFVTCEVLFCVPTSNIFPLQKKSHTFFLSFSGQLTPHIFRKRVRMHFPDFANVIFNGAIPLFIPIVYRRGINWVISSGGPNLRFRAESMFALCVWKGAKTDPKITHPKHTPEESVQKSKLFKFRQISVWNSARNTASGETLFPPRRSRRRRRGRKALSKVNRPKSNSPIASKATRIGEKEKSGGGGGASIHTELILNK